MKVKISLKELGELARVYPNMTVLDFINNVEVIFNEKNNSRTIRLCS